MSPHTRNAAEQSRRAQICTSGGPRTGHWAVDGDEVRLAAHELRGIVEDEERLRLGEAAFVKEMVPEQFVVRLHALVCRVEDIELLVCGLMCVRRLDLNVIQTTPEDIIIIIRLAPANE